MNLGLFNKEIDQHFLVFKDILLDIVSELINELVNDYPGARVLKILHDHMVVLSGALSVSVDQHEFSIPHRSINHVHILRVENVCLALGVLFNELPGLLLVLAQRLGDSTIVSFNKMLWRTILV